MGDLTKGQYMLKRQAIEEELERIQPPVDLRLDEAAAVLDDFGRFWSLEPSPAERRELLATLFERVWEDDGAIVAVKPQAPFLRYFQTADELARHRARKRGDKSGSDGGQTHVRHPIEIRDC